MGDVFEYIVDGTSGINPDDVAGSCIVAGVCSLGTVGKGYLLGKSSDLDGTLGAGPLVDRLRDIFSSGGQDTVLIAVPVTSATAGTIGDVTHTGTGAEVTVAGTVKAAGDVILEIVQGGGRNEGTYILTVDGGDNWDAEKTIPTDGVVSVGTTGVTITVPDVGDMVEGDTYSFTVTAPSPSISGVMTAIEQPLSLYDVEFVYVVGPSDSTDWAAMGAKADELWGAHRPVFFIGETRLPDSGEDLDTWTAAMVSEASGYAHRFVSICAAFGEVSDSGGKRLTRNWAGLMAGRIMSIPVMRAIGRVRDGGISQGSLPDDFTESMQQMLSKAGFVTAKHYAGLDSPYWGDANTLADSTSDYQYIEVLRTVFKAVRKARIAALNSIHDEAGDPLAEGGATGLRYLKANISSALNSMKAAVPKELADFIINIPDGQDIVNNGVAVEMQLIGIPIIRQIELYASYIYAGSTLDPRLDE
jgi:hypothetical protein